MISTVCLSCTFLHYRIHHDAHIAPAYPGLCPSPFFSSNGPLDTESLNTSRYSTSPPPQKSVGLLEPKSSFLHHGLVPLSQPGHHSFSAVEVLLMGLLSLLSLFNCSCVLAGTVPRYQNSALPAPQVRKGNVQCGAIANNVALLR